MNVARTAHLDIKPRASVPGEKRTGLLGAARPKPRGARRGRRSGATQNQHHNVANKTKTKRLTNPQSFSYEVSHLRGDGTSSSEIFGPGMEALPYVRPVGHFVDLAHLFSGKLSW